MTEPEITMLLVEDNPIHIELSLRAFKEHDFARHVQIECTGEEALAYLLRRGQGAPGPRPLPKVVLLDMKLPKVDGLEMLRRIRADDRLRGLPVVMFTASREERDIIASYELGANSYIVKPVDFDEFLEIVDQIGFYWLKLNELPP